ncbi:MAG: hypothetical protein U0795_11320 [Pirellulales bacterium]
MLTGLMLTGCQRAAPPVPRRTAQQSQQSAGAATSTDLDQAMEFLFRIDEFDPVQARMQIHHHLNEWINRQPPDPQWQHDPMFDRLDRNRFPHIPPSESLRTLRFQLFDTFMLQEAVWMRDVSNWVSTGPLHDPTLAEWFRQLQAERGADHAAQVGEMARLFDWTIRNIQLDPTTSENPGEPLPAGTLTESQMRQADGTFFPWETLLLGHGDFIERARVFIHLARQRGVPAVMLGVSSPAGDYERPWAVATLVDDELYLFEPRLGIPIPDVLPAAGESSDTGGRRAGIMRLSELVQAPERVTELYADDTTGLGLRASDAKQLIALIDATPTYLSQRMRLLESQLSGDRKVVLSFAATPLRRRLETLKGIAQVRMWIQPYEVLRFQSELPNFPNYLTELLVERIPFDSRTPLSQGRILHFRGQLDKTKDRPGAKIFYMEARVFDENQVREELKRSLQRAKVRDNPGAATIELTTEELARVEAGVSMASGLAEQSRVGAAYWLGLLCFDNAQYRIARDYFSLRVLEKHPQTFWRHGAHYNLARTDEMLGHTDHQPALVSKSIELLQNSAADDPQAIGNRWRARLITPAQPETTPAQPETTPAQPEATPAQPEAPPTQPEAPAAQSETTPAQPETTPAQTDSAPTTETD